MMIKNIKILSLLLAIVLSSCGGTSQIEKDALSAANFMCEMRMYFNRLSEGDFEVLEVIDELENKYQADINNIVENYPIETEEGQRFADLVNQELEKCTHEPF